MPNHITPVVLVGAPPTFIETADPDELAVAREAFFAQWKYVHGDLPPEALQPFAGRRVTGRLIETDPDVLDEWARRGEFDLTEVYREMFG